MNLEYLREIGFSCNTLKYRVLPIKLAYQIITKFIIVVITLLQS